MEQGQIGAEEFMEGIRGLLATMLESCDRIPQSELSRFSAREVIGNCPVCGNPVYEGKKNFYCSNRECRFALWKESHYLSGMKKSLDKKMASDLLRQGRTHVKDFYSAKKDKTFEADLVLNIEDGQARYGLDFGSGAKHRSKKKSGRD